MVSLLRLIALSLCWARPGTRSVQYSRSFTRHRMYFYATAITRHHLSRLENRLPIQLIAFASLLWHNKPDPNCSVALGTSRLPRYFLSSTNLLLHNTEYPSYILVIHCPILITIAMLLLVLLLLLLLLFPHIGPISRNRGHTRGY